MGDLMSNPAQVGWINWQYFMEMTVHLDLRMDILKTTSGWIRVTIQDSPGFCSGEMGCLLVGGEGPSEQTGLQVGV